MASRTQFDPDLIRRYDRDGPRYTSYPTAQQFRPEFEADAYRRSALLSNIDRSPLSIYVHVPFCESPCFYCGCNRTITRDHTQAVTYVELLNKEIELQASLFDSRRVVSQIHFGGGTPTFLSPDQLAGILGTIARRFTLAADRECSIEVDPRTVNPAIVQALGHMGFSRMSLGVQDFDPEVQKAVNRTQSVETVRDVIVAARGAGFKSIAFDLIYGLPLQTPESFARTLELVMQLRPDRIAAYGYAHMPQLFKPQRQIRETDLPSAATRLELLQLTVESLTSAGYEYIGLDHFALPEDELCKARRTGGLHRNFQGYSTHAGCDLIGLGVSAISKVGNAYAQNAKDLQRYAELLQRGSLPVARGLILTVDDVLRAEIIQQLMCLGIVDCRSIEKRYALDFFSYFEAELQALNGLRDDGLVSSSDQRISVTEKGRFMLRNIAVIFDRHNRTNQHQRQSRTI